MFIEIFINQSINKVNWTCYNVMWILVWAEVPLLFIAKMFFLSINKVILSNSFAKSESADQHFPVISNETQTSPTFQAPHGRDCSEKVFNN